MYIEDHTPFTDLFTHFIADFICATPRLARGRDFPLCTFRLLCNCKSSARVSSSRLRRDFPNCQHGCLVSKTKLAPSDHFLRSLLQITRSSPSSHTHSFPYTASDSAAVFSCTLSPVSSLPTYPLITKTTESTCTSTKPSPACWLAWPPSLVLRVTALVCPSPRAINSALDAY